MQFHQRREAKPHTIGISLGKRRAQHGIKQESGFKIRPGWCVLDGADPIAQVEFLRALLHRTEKPLQPPPQVRGFADVRFGAGIRSPQQKNSRRGRDGGKYLRIPLRRKFQPIRQHGMILGEFRCGEYLPKIRVPKLLAEVRALQRHNAAHLMQPRPHALADPVAQSFAAARRPRR